MALKGWWKLDGNANDSSGLGHNGSIINPGNGVYTWGRAVPQQLGGFRNKANAYLSVPANSDFNSITHTVAFWFKPNYNDTDTYNVALSFSNGSIGWLCGRNSSGYLYVERLGGPIISTGIAASKGVWYHFTIVTVSTTMYFYVNGVLINSATVATWPSGLPLRTNWAAANYLNVVDDIRFYDSDERVNISSIYNEAFSFPAIYELRTTGGDYITYNDMATVVRAMYPLPWNVNIYCQGGQTFGSDGTGNDTLSPSGGVGNNKTVWVTTDPSESSRSTILGRIVTDSPSIATCLKMSKLKLYGTYSSVVPYGDSTGSNTILRVEDCFSATSGGSTLFAGAIGSKIRECTIARADGLSFTLTNNAAACNNLFTIYSASANTITTSVTANNKNNTFFNYGTGSLAPVTPSYWVNSVTGNPNTVQAIITSSGDTPATIVARDVHLTAASTTCLGNGDFDTTTFTDIEGKTRYNASVLIGSEWYRKHDIAVNTVDIGIAISSNGQLQTTANWNNGSGQFLQSKDYGQSWVPLAGSPIDSFYDVCCSDSGQYLVAPCINSNRAYRSSDYGVTWTILPYTFTLGYKAKCSADGKYFIITTISNGFYLSTDYGVTWNQSGVGQPTTGRWEVPALSSDGKYQLVGARNNNQRAFSSNYGANWTITSVSGGPSGSAMSLSGQYMTHATKNSYYIFRSSDYGASWTSMASPVAYPNTMRMSGDGKFRIVISDDYSRPIYYSSDYGTTWTAASVYGISGLNYLGLGMSSNGLYASIVATSTGSNGFILTSPFSSPF